MARKIKAGSSYEAFGETIKAVINAALIYFEISPDNEKASDIIMTKVGEVEKAHFNFL